MAPVTNSAQAIMWADSLAFVVISSKPADDPWYVSIVATIQRLFAAIVAAVSDFFSTHSAEIQAVWDWIVVHVQSFTASVQAFISDHPIECIVAASLIIIIALAMVLPQVLMYFLWALGYTAHGIVEGSTAAIYQSSVLGGYIIKGSWFALAQSTAAGGNFVSAAPWPVTVIGCVLLGGAIALLVAAAKK